MDEDAQKIAEEVTDEQVSHQEMHQVFAAELAGMAGNSTDMAVKHLLNWLSGDTGDVPVQQLIRWAAKSHPSEPEAKAVPLLAKGVADIATAASAALTILQAGTTSRRPARLAQAANAGSRPENSTKAAERFQRHEERIQRLTSAWSASPWLSKALIGSGGERERIALEMLKEELLHEQVEEAIINDAVTMNETDETGWLQGLDGDNDREISEMSAFLHETEMMAAMMDISTPWPSRKTQDIMSSTTARASSIPPSTTAVTPTPLSTILPMSSKMVQDPVLSTNARMPVTTSRAPSTFLSTPAPATSSSWKSTLQLRPAALTMLYNEVHAFIEEVIGFYNPLVEADSASSLSAAAGFEIVSEGAHPIQTPPLSELASGMTAVEVDSPGEPVSTNVL